MMSLRIDSLVIWKKKFGSPIATGATLPKSGLNLCHMLRSGLTQVEFIFQVT